jgi:hypothetical protein
MIYESLSDYLYALMGKGELVFTKTEALSALGISDAALRNSIKRQVASKKVLRLMKECYLIIPPEHQNLGFVPPETFIHDLMGKMEIPYYVCLLSASSFYGSTHQATQIFQVMVEKHLRPISLKNTRIVFYVHKKFDQMPTNSLKTDRGPLVVSTPETTIFELMFYNSQSGYLNHIATILEELVPSLKTPALRIQDLRFLMTKFPLTVSQRLGYLFEALGHQDISDVFLEYLHHKKPVVYLPLSSKNPLKEGIKSPKWHLIINQEIETDL